MNCIHDGILRAHLDGELAGFELAGIAAHLVSCADCRDRFEKVRAEKAQTDNLLATLAPAADRITINPATAYAQFNQFRATHEPKAS